MREPWFAARVERARWTWRGNRTLVKTSLQRTIWLTLRALLQSPLKPDKGEDERKLRSV